MKRQEKKKLIELHSPKSPIFKDCFFAFIFGGLYLLLKNSSNTTFILCILSELVMVLQVKTNNKYTKLLSFQTKQRCYVYIFGENLSSLEVDEFDDKVYIGRLGSKLLH